MSRLNDLLRRLEKTDPALAKDLKREVDALSGRRAFGLNFERHAPEAVELPGRPVRRGDKVRILPPRGSKASAGDDRLWRVMRILQDSEGVRTASLELIDGEDETAQSCVEDLVVVAEFRDPIYPGLVSTGKVERGGDKPFNAVINAENYHALQTLLFTHRAKIDAIYIDPPYNTGAKDWKYNNDYIEGEDLYRHSKWLAFMERRLKLAKELLNPEDSVLIVTIDEKEYLRLGLLLEQIFPEANIQMVSSVINPSGSSRSAGFSRAEEYIYFVLFGAADLVPGSSDMLRNETAAQPVRWDGLMRTGGASDREDRPGMFFPIYFCHETGSLHSIGEPIPLDENREQNVAPPGTFAVWPLSGERERRWRVGPQKARELAEKGYLKFGPWKKGHHTRTIYYLPSGTANRVDTEEIEIVSRDQHGTVVLASEMRKLRPMSIWNMNSHSATEWGTGTVRTLLPGRSFPYPKSLYAVEDSLRFFVKNKPAAVVLDFFSGSGTTAHALMRLNRQDGGHRQSISVTNNEVSAEEQKILRKQGLRPGDEKWEALGICDYITKPRVAAAITGKTPTGDPIKSDYKFTDEFPMSDGFDENFEFFTLTYETPLRVASNREFSKVAPLLWLRAGSKGARIEDVSMGWGIADTYGVLADLNQSDAFVEAILAKAGIRMAFIVTDEDRLFESVVRELPDHVEPVRMYEAYLQNFEIETSRSAL